MIILPTQKQPSCKKKMWPYSKWLVWKKKGSSQEMALITTIQVNFIIFCSGCFECCWTITGSMQGDFTLSQLSTGWLDSYWTVYCLPWMLLNCQRLQLNCMQGDFTLSELSTAWTTWFLLNCILFVLNVVELSQALADLHAGWFYSIWTFHRVTRFLPNCILIVLNVAELS